MRNHDLYSNYAELKAAEREGVDYRVCMTDRRSPVAIIAPHGGMIERRTSEIAAAIAGDTFSLYCFEGLRSGSRELHVTSHLFDEFRGVALVEACEFAVAIHGRQDREDPVGIWLGGRGTTLLDDMAGELASAGFHVKTAGHPFPAEEQLNICNRGKSRGGVQLELPMKLRTDLVSDARLLSSFVGAARRAINGYLAKSP